MKTIIHSHNKGVESINPRMLAGVEKSILKIVSPLGRNCATRLRDEIRRDLRNLGWSDRVRIRAKLGLTLTAINGQVGLCLQTGNMARFYADLLKLQVSFSDKNIKSAIMILPTRKAARQMGSNIATFERLVSELEVFKSIISMPLVIIGFFQEGD